MSSAADTTGPTVPDEQTAAAQREIRNQLAQGQISLSEVLRRGRTDDVIGQMLLNAVLGSLPGVGTIRTGQLMARLGIADDRRVRGLGADQRAALEREFGG